MAESTLSLQYEDVVKAVAYYLGFGHKASTSLSAGDLTRVDAIMQEGLRRLLYPEIPHQWRWLKPTRTVNVWGSLGGADTNKIAAIDGQVIDLEDTAVLYETAIGNTFVFDDSGNGYTITAIDATSTPRTVTVSGDISGESAGGASDTWTITTSGNYRLPDDFGAIIGPLYYPADEEYPPIPVRGQGEILHLRQTNTDTGQPYVAAVRPLTTDGTSGQRWELLMHPKPDATYTLSYQYALLPDKITTAAPYIYGGMPVSSAFQASCLAVAEELENDEKGLHYNTYIARLRTAIDHDNRTAPDSLGPNLDYSDARSRASRKLSHMLDDGYVTYNGAIP